MSTKEKSQELQIIKADILAKNVCPELAAGATQLVFGDGSPDADILLVGEAPGKNEDLQGLPFVGAIGAIQLWASDPLDMAAGIAVIMLLLLFTRRVLVSGELLGWAFLGFVPLAILFTRQVWSGYFDITRAVAPVLTAFVLLVFLAGRATERTSVRP